MTNPAILYQLLLAVSILLTNAASSGNPTQVQQAILTAQQTISVVQESGVFNPVAPVYETSTLKAATNSQPAAPIITPPVPVSEVTSTPYSGSWVCYDPATAPHEAVTTNPSACGKGTTPMTMPDYQKMF